MGVTKPTGTGKVQPLGAATSNPKTQAGPLPRKGVPRPVAGKGASAAAESGTQSKPDLLNRDPNHVNDHVRVSKTF